MGDPFILQSNTVTPIECLHYALNLPTSTVITGIDSMKILDQAIEAAQTFRPMSKEAVVALLAAERYDEAQPYKDFQHAARPARSRRSRTTQPAARDHG